VKGYWVFSEKSYLRLIRQGYITLTTAKRNGILWRYMVKGART
jgi:hypothetical protein